MVQGSGTERDPWAGVRDGEGSGWEPGGLSRMRGGWNMGGAVEREARGDSQGDGDSGEDGLGGKSEVWLGLNSGFLKAQKQTFSKSSLHSQWGVVVSGAEKSPPPVSAATPKPKPFILPWDEIQNAPRGVSPHDPWTKISLNAGVFICCVHCYFPT